MTVAATAKRRRKQMKLDRRFKRRDPVSAARRLEKVKQTEARMRMRK